MLSLQLALATFSIDDPMNLSYLLKRLGWIAGILRAERNALACVKPIPASRVPVRQELFLKKNSNS